MSYTPPNPNGQATAANSSPVVIASNQSPLPIAAGTLALTGRPDGFLRTQIDPTTLLFDTFESLDTTNTWTLGGTVVPTGVNGVLSVAPGTAASATSYATSKPTFTQGSAAFLQFSSVITIEADVIAGNQRTWGLGIITTPTFAAPITNGVVFELDSAAGALIGSVYSGGARTQTLALTRPTDATAHRYALYYKTSRVYFEIDNIAVGSLPFPNPAISALSVVIASVNGGTALATGAALNSTLLGLGDTGRNATKLADGTYPWRTVTVKPASATPVGTDTALVVAVSPNSPPTSDKLTIPYTALAAIGVLFSADTAGYSSVSFQTGPTWVATITPECSNDNVNWITLVATDTNYGSTTNSITSTGRVFILPCVARYVRARVTAWTSGSVTGSATLVRDANSTNILNQVTVLQGTAASLNMTATPIALTKGTQGTTGFTTQDLKDAGRNAIHFYMLIPVLTTATDTLQSLTGTSGGLTVTATATPALVTAGKKMRITRLAATYIPTATSGYGIVKLRFNTAGAVTVSSPVAAMIVIGSGAPATVNAAASEEATLGDGWEFAAGTGIGVSAQGFAAATATAVGYLLVSATGYEY